jgi:3-oxoacyl-[acyl-carrier-protein] synthase-3
MKARITAVEYVLAKGVSSSKQLPVDRPDRKVGKIAAATGFQPLLVAATWEYTSAIATRAATKLFDLHEIDRAGVDYVILCTQNPDFALPTTACLVQHELGLRTSIGAIDINRGRLGYIYALGLAKGLIETGQVNNVLVLTADTHSAQISPDDKMTSPVVTEGATATLIVGDYKEESLSGFVLSTVGDGGSLRPEVGGSDIFGLFPGAVIQCMDSVLEKASLEHGDIDLYLLDQAHWHSTELLSDQLGIDPAKVYPAQRDHVEAGYLTNATALADAIAAGLVVQGSRVLLVGFGVGKSWGGVVATW